MSADPHHDQRFDQLLLGVVWTLLLGGLALILQPLVVPSKTQQTHALCEALWDSRDPSAFDRAQKLLQQHSDDPLVIATAAETAGRAGENHLALELFSRLPLDGGWWQFVSLTGQARRQGVLGRLSEAESLLKRALALQPYDIDANNLLGHFLQVEGRVWESAPYFFVQILQGKCRGDELLATASLERLFRDDVRLVRLVSELDPPELMLELARARREIMNNLLPEAEERLRKLLKVHPELGEAQGRLGRLVIDRGDQAEFIRWRGSLPEAARSHPEVWYVEGLQARRQGQVQGAVHCFLQALTLSPNHLGANVQIAGVLELSGDASSAAVFKRRGQLLTELESNLNLIRENADVELMQRTAEILGELGRYWEAAGWCYVMTRMEIPRDLPRRQMRRWLQLAQSSLLPTAPAKLPSQLLDLHRFPAPRWEFSPSTPAVEFTSETADSRWSFTDDAESAGLQFRYFEGTNEANRLEHIFNVMGGGVGAIDFDGDYWPDLYFAQANNWRDPQPQPQHLDRLFRNLQGERFQDVTAACRIHEAEFSHGVTVGDFDQDGFADIYVGNKGPNRLFHNNGDGTFSDVTEAAGVGGQEWSTSSVFADFNSDGLPDLYVLNYTLLQETADKECTRPNGERIACTPDVLTAEHDRLYLNRGDGGFEDVSEAAGIRVPDGKGLGVVVWDFNLDGRLGLFVSNDTTPNYLFVNSGTSPQGVPLFQEEGIIRGVASDVDGKSQASMGVAAGDANGDGLIDLFITNFVAEANAYYSQRPDGFFDELSRSQGLWDASFWMNGFGSQFADLNGDGWDDLILSNGHVDQRTPQGNGDRMPPQLFVNLAGKRFREVSPDKLGTFFQGRYLGRGMAKLDWNRDGMTDVAISHLHGPAALVTNRTEPGANRLTIRLVGRNGVREPTGARVRIREPLSPRVCLQTAGDGFLATNERRHDFPVPAGALHVVVEVTWPHGGVEEWSIPAPAGENLLIEGNPRSFQIR